MHKGYHRKPGTDYLSPLQAFSMPVETRLKHYVAHPSKSQTVEFHLWDLDVAFEVTGQQRRRLLKKQRHPMANAV